MHNTSIDRRMSPSSLRVMCAIVLALALTGTPTAFAQAPGSDSPASTAQVQQVAQEIRRTLATIQAIPGAFPAVSAVVVQGDATPLMYVHGDVHAGRPDQVDSRSLFYIASQTKSFVGLLAASLDESGVLPLDTTLAQIWPQLVLPAPAEPATITMADLLSHQDQLKTDTLNFLTAYVRDVPASDYPRMLANYTTARDDGFRYANLGDLIYGAALETRTGRSWKDWLKQEVLTPLRLDHTHARASRASSPQVTWNHHWDGHQWIALPPKSDALMHAAGGLLASSDDMADWMRANLRRRSPTSTPSSRSFELAQRPIAQADLSDGEFVCDGYSLGWYACSYRNQSVLMHPGSYPGVVSVTLLVPAIQSGLSLVVTSDSAMEGLELELMKAFVGLATGQAGEIERLQRATANYPARLARVVAARADAMQMARQEPVWGGWSWTPNNDELAKYTGTFHSDRLGTLDVASDSRGLDARLGALHLSLAPARPDLFGASENVLDPPEAFEYAADADSLRWKETTFTRVRNASE